MGRLRTISHLLRVRQWVKNLFVVFPLLFSGVLRAENADNAANVVWSAIAMTAVATLCFCLWSSAVYILNDLCDREQDKNHPRKKDRPVASGLISVPLASVICVALALLPFGAWFPEIAGRSVPGSFFAVGGLFLLNNVLYSLKLRAVAICDVLSIALGFVLRILGGCFVLGVEPSQWILVCGFSLALFLGFGKRRMELALGNDRSEGVRISLQGYSCEFLNLLLGITAGTSLVSYLLYSISPDTVAIHGPNSMLYATPFVFYGVFRYTWLSLQGKFDGPDEVIFRDWPFLLNGILWVVTVLALIFV